ncbi:hypothetical protein D9M68_627670 [compost metagenome]
MATSDQLIPSPTVIWTRRGEADTRAFVDGVIRDWHRTGLLVKEAERFGVPTGYLKAASAAAREGRFESAPPEAQPKP